MLNKTPQPMLNICLFTDSFLPKVGGMELAVHYLANALCTRGCRVTVIAKYNKGALPERRYALTRYGNRLPLSGRSGMDALAGIAALLRSHYQRPFDLINCHGASYAGSRVYLTKKSGLLNRPVVITPHGEDIQIVPEVGYGLRLTPKLDRTIRRNLKAADGVTAISASIVKQLSFLAPDKISTIPNGIHLGEFNSRQSDFLHRYLNLPPACSIVLSVGRNHRVKGYEYGVRAFAAVARERPEHPLKYVIIGKNTHLLLPLIKNLNLQGMVFAIPQMRREDIVRAYASAWCFLSPSLSEGLSLVSIEAMACGLPLIVTDVPGNADIVKENNCGLIVQAKAPREIARGLLHLWEHPREHRLYQQKALGRAPAYDWSAIADRYIGVYRQIIARTWSAAQAPAALGQK
ncbi:MAG: glycosyltransferase family 1 protein [Desulfobacteraceae bacterium]|nr:MAG: glycosyltransferase family 1 protein [Desulfobacteraceae bacterium]